MLYTSIEGLKIRFGEEVLLKLASKNGKLDEEKLTVAIADASLMIDGYLMGRYKLPLKTVPNVLELYCCYIARYCCEKFLATEQARKDYESSIQFLEKIASGKISLGDVEDSSADDSKGDQGNYLVVVKSKPCVFSRE